MSKRKNMSIKQNNMRLVKSATTILMIGILFLAGFSAVPVLGESTTMKINLHKGWNLITIPVENNMMASDLLEKITNCKVISRWDVAEQSFKSYIVDGPHSFDFPIQSGLGYFICVENDTSLIVSGETIENLNVPLNHGYNLLGYYQSDITTASALKNKQKLVYRSSGDKDFSIKQGDGFFVLIDNKAPQTQVFISGKPGLNGWYKSDVFVSLVASDDLSGVYATFYSINGGLFVDYSGAFLIPVDGVYKIEYFSKDIAGNVEFITTDGIDSLKSICLKIDKTVPTTTCTIIKELNSAKISFNAFDLTSGIDKIYFSLDGAQYSTYNATLFIGPGFHTLSYYSVDYAGNIEMKKSETISVGKPVKPNANIQVID
jgi:hypothetical protein